MSKVEMGDTRKRSWPSVTVIVPIAGKTVDLKRRLQCLLQQEYPAYTLILVTQDETDPAVPVIRELVAGEMKARHVQAGRSAACSQKNHNLVQGVCAAGPATDILVFCDSGHYAPPDWLERLIAPLQDPSVTVSSGYHQVFPESRCFCSIGRAISVLALNLVRRIPAFTQPWGGAMAMRAADFNNHNIAELWMATIVDDVTLADHLQKKKLTVAIPADADLRTEIEDCSLRAWESWLIRQWAYLKFVFPKLWFFTGLAGIIFTFLICLGIVIVLAWDLETFPAPYVHGAALSLAILTVGIFLFRTRHPAPGSAVLWLPAFLAVLFMAGWCHGRTWFSHTLTWAGISYKVSAGGKVVEIMRPDEQGKGT
jgi:ceramide glucosyltransferase